MTFKEGKPNQNRKQQLFNARVEDTKLKGNEYVPVSYVEPKEQKLETNKEQLSEVAELLKNNKIAQVVVHGGDRKKDINGEKEVWSLSPDLDAQSSAILLNFFNKKSLDEIYESEAFSSIIPKGGTDADLEKVKDGLIVYIDNGGRWLEVEKDGKRTKVYLDHHGKGKREPTSATKMVYDFQKETGLDTTKENPWLADYVEGVTSFDNLSYLENKDAKGDKTFNRKYFIQKWPFTLNHLARHLSPQIVMQMFEKGYVKDFNQELSDEDAEKEIGIEVSEDGKTIKKKVKIKDLPTTDGRTVKELIIQETNHKKVQVGKANNFQYESNIIKTLEGIEKADKYESPDLGKVVYHNFKKIKNKNGNGHQINLVPYHLGFIGTKAEGYDTFAVWDQKRNQFFINSNQDGLAKVIELLNEADPGCVTDVRGVMVFGKIKNLTESQFLQIITKGDAKVATETKSEPTATVEEKKEESNDREISELNKQLEAITTNEKLTEPEKLMKTSGIALPILEPIMENIPAEQKLALAELTGDKANAIRKNKIITEYLKAKIDGSNPELVEEIEKLINQDKVVKDIKEETENQKAEVKVSETIPNEKEITKKKAEIEKINEKREKELNTNFSIQSDIIADAFKNNKDKFKRKDNGTNDYDYPKEITHKGTVFKLGYTANDHFTVTNTKTGFETKATHTYIYNMTESSYYADKNYAEKVAQEEAKINAKYDKEIRILELKEKIRESKEKSKIFADKVKEIEEMMVILAEQINALPDEAKVDESASK